VPRYRSPRALLLGLALSAGCNPVEGFVERGIEEKLPAIIGPADRYTVDVTGLRTSTGEAERVAVHGERVRLEDAPVLDRLDLDLRGVRFDRATNRLDRVERAQATARVLPADLTVFLDAHRNVRGATLTLLPPGGATLRFRPEAGGFAVPEGVAVELSGRLAAEAGRVRFEVTEVRAAGLNLGRTVARRLSEEINPLVDLTGTEIGLRVTGIRVEPDAVVVEATGDPSRLRPR
jgi:hypothetical protein